MLLWSWYFSLSIAFDKTNVIILNKCKIKTKIKKKKKNQVLMWKRLFRVREGEIVSLKNSFPSSMTLFPISTEREFLCIVSYPCRENNFTVTQNFNLTSLKSPNVSFHARFVEDKYFEPTSFFSFFFCYLKNCLLKLLFSFSRSKNCFRF